MGSVETKQKDYKMNGLNFLFWVIGSVITLIVAGTLGLIAWALFKVNSHRSRIDYDRVENALSKRGGNIKGKEE